MQKWLYGSKKHRANNCQGQRVNNRTARARWSRYAVLNCQAESMFYGLYVPEDIIGLIYSTLCEVHIIIYGAVVRVL